MGKVLLGRVARGLRVWVGFLLFTTLDGAVWAQPAGQATSVWRRFRLSFSFFTIFRLIIADFSSLFLAEPPGYYKFGLIPRYKLSKRKTKSVIYYFYVMG